MPDIFGELAHEWRELTRHGHHAAPQQPRTCGQCQDGLIPVNGCTCGDGLPPYGHEPGCGWEPCPGGCRDILHPPYQTPASVPVNLQAATAAQPPGGPMSLASDVEQGWTAVKNETAKFEAGLPAVLEKARKFEASPFAAIAEKAAAAVLPPEGVAVAVKAAESILDDLIALYNPPQPVAAAPDAPAAPAPAQ